MHWYTHHGEKLNTLYKMKGEQKYRKENLRWKRTTEFFTYFYL